MTEATNARAQLDVLEALGLELIESGHPTGETARILRACAFALGAPDASVTMLGETIILENAAPDGTTTHRTVTADAIDAIDCARLRSLMAVARSIVGGGVGVAAAREAIERARSASTPWWWSCTGLALLAFCITLQVGVGWMPCLTAAGIHLTAVVVGHVAGRARVPRLFSVTAQALTGGTLAVGLEALGVVTPIGAAAALAVSWLLIVPLPQLVAAVTDLIDSEYLAALTRFANIAMTLGGIGIGGFLTVALSSYTGFERPADLTLPTLAAPLVLLFSALGAVANAYANGGRANLVIPAALTGIGTGAVNLLLLRGAGIDPTWASTATAVVLGFAVTLPRSQFSHPPQVLALMGITGALLPGLTVFHGVIRAMANGSGAEYFVDATWVCVGLGVGVTFGFFLGSYGTRRRAALFRPGK